MKRFFILPFLSITDTALNAMDLGDKDFGPEVAGIGGSFVKSHKTLTSEFLPSSYAPLKVSRIDMCRAIYRIRDNTAPIEGLAFLHKVIADIFISHEFKYGAAINIANYDKDPEGVLRGIGALRYLATCHARIDYKIRFRSALRVAKHAPDDAPEMFKIALSAWAKLDPWELRMEDIQEGKKLIDVLFKPTEE